MEVTRALRGGVVVENGDDRNESRMSESVVWMWEYIVFSSSYVRALRQLSLKAHRG
jgi:hypothetical protein